MNDAACNDLHAAFVLSRLVLVEDSVKPVFKQPGHLVRGNERADLIVLSGSLLVPAYVIVCVVIDDRAVRSAIENRTVGLKREEK